MPEQIAVLSKHLFDDMGLRLVKDTSERVFSWAVGLDVEGRERVEVGDEVDVLVASNGAVRLTDGALPPGVRLVKHEGRLRGVFTHEGLYEATVTVGPVVKYDPLGSPGGPGDPGVWIPVGQARQVPEPALSEFPATVGDLDDADKDRRWRRLVMLLMRLVLLMLSWRHCLTRRMRTRNCGCCSGRLMRMIVWLWRGIRRLLLRIRRLFLFCARM